MPYFLCTESFFLTPGLSYCCVYKDDENNVVIILRTCVEPASLKFLRISGIVTPSWVFFTSNSSFVGMKHTQCSFLIFTQDKYQLCGK